MLSVKDDEHITVNFKYNTNKTRAVCRVSGALRCQHDNKRSRTKQQQQLQLQLHVHIYKHIKKRLRTLAKNLPNHNTII